MCWIGFVGEIWDKKELFYDKGVRGVVGIFLGIELEWVKFDEREDFNCFCGRYGV